MARRDNEGIQTGLGLLILNEGISSRSELRERAIAEGLYTSEGSFSRDLAQLRKSEGALDTFFFTGRGNNGGGRQSVIVNGVKMKLRKAKDGETTDGWKFKKKGGTFTASYSSGSSGNPEGKQYEENDDDDGSDYYLLDPDGYYDERSDDNDDSNSDDEEERDDDDGGYDDY